LKVKGKHVKVKTNISKEKCPECGKNLRVKPGCCGNTKIYMRCWCGYERIIESDEGEVVNDNPENIGGIDNDNII